jgi:hypothetical protein
MTKKSPSHSPFLLGVSFISRFVCRGFQSDTANNGPFKKKGRNNTIISTHLEDVIALEDSTANLLDAVGGYVVKLLNQRFAQSVDSIKELNVCVNVDKAI